MTSPKTYNEKGSILITVALISVTLLILTALSIDTSMLTLADNMQQQNSERLAQAGLQAWKTSNLSSELGKIQLARDRVKEILDESFVLFEQNPSEDKTVGVTNLNYAQVKYGNWYFEDPGCKAASSLFNPTDPCPCPQNIFTKPCFEEMNTSDLGNPGETINAYQVTLESTNSNRIKTAFATVFGVNSMKIKSSSTAAVFPKNIVFLLDLSRSSFNETHFDLNRIQPDTINYPGHIISREMPTYNASIAANNINFASEYAYKCEHTDPSACPSHINSGTETFDCEAPGSCPMAIYPGLDQNALWNDPISSITAKGRRTPGPYSTFSFQHFVDDFAGIELADSANYGFYYVDAHCQTYNNPGILTEYMRECNIDNNFGPEPFSSMLRGIKHGLNQLQPFDKVALIGFDSDARNYQRRFHSGVTAASGPLSQATASGLEAPLPANESLNLDPIMESLHQALFVELRDANYFISRVQNHHFIPIGEDLLDIPAALKEAVTLLKNSPEYETSENQIILLSDGLTNCSSGVCAADYASHLNSLQETKLTINNELLPENIEFHFIHLGDDTGAHTLLRQGIIPKEKECLSQEALEAADPNGRDILSLPSLVNSCSSCADPDSCAACTSSAADFDNMMLGLGKYYGPSSLYSETLATGGTYSSIVPPCDPLDLSPGLTLAECQNGIFETSITAQCSNNGSSNAAAIVSGSKITDSSGRIICNPSCKSKATQVEEAMNKILDDSSYLIVQ